MGKGKNGKGKRSVWFGMPVYVVGLLVPYLVVTGLMVGCMVGFGVLVSVDVVPIEWLMNPVFFLSVMLPLVGVVCVAMLVFAYRVGKFQKRLKAARGRVCLRCGYELGEGLVVCSECGGEWSVEGLSRLWRKRVGLDR